MAHDLRQAIGFRRLPASDQREQELRDQWYETKERADGLPTTSPEAQYFVLIDQKLRDYLWQRACKIIAEDRAKHPKARRNQPAVKRQPHEQERYLP